MTERRILHLQLGDDGGTERFFVNLTRAFAAHGAEQRFVIRPGRRWRSDVAELGEIMEGRFRSVSVETFVKTRALHRMIARWQPDVIMAWRAPPSRLIPNLPGPLKLTRLGDYPRHLKHFRHNDCLVTNVPSIERHCRDIGWTKPIHLISNFPKQVTPNPVRRSALDTPDDAFLVCGPGRFVTYKGFDTLVRAVAQAPGVWLWLVGDGDERASLGKLVEELGIGARTRFAGWADEPLDYMAAADLVVMPSRIEPLGNVLIEAWHAGVPTVSTRSEGPSWFATDGDNTLLVDIDDDGAMAAAILKVRDEPALGPQLVAGGKRKLEARFTVERVVEEYFAMFDSYRPPAAP